MPVTDLITAEVSSPEKLPVAALSLPPKVLLPVKCASLPLTVPELDTEKASPIRMPLDPMDIPPLVRLPSVIVHAPIFEPPAAVSMPSIVTDFAYSAPFLVAPKFSPSTSAQPDKTGLPAIEASVLDPVEIKTLLEAPRVPLWIDRSSIVKALSPLPIVPIRTLKPASV